MIAQHSSRYNVLASLRDENRPHSGNRTERKEAGLLGPSQAQADWGQTLPSLALSWAEQEPTCAQLWLTCAELGPVGSNLAPAWAQLEPNWGPILRNLCTFGRKLGLAWSCVGASGAEVGPKTGPIWQLGLAQTPIKLKPCDAHGSPSHVQSGAAWDLLAAASHQVRPNEDTTWGTLLAKKMEN